MRTLNTIHLNSDLDFYSHCRMPARRVVKHFNIFEHTRIGELFSSKITLPKYENVELIVICNPPL